MISKKITEIYKEQENRMIRTIEQTIYDDGLKVYREQRSCFDAQFQDLERERIRILKNRKRTKKEKARALRLNTKSVMLICIRALQQTILHYKELYYENDYYRFNTLLKAAGAPDLPA